jgi:hypothetical protein
LEKSDKFPKILTCLELPDCEFRLAMVKSELSIQALLGLGLKENEKSV